MADDFGTIVAPGFRYRLTPEDVLWLGRSAAFESGGDRAGDPAAVMWTFAQRLTLSTFRGWTMARLVQGHSQPTNPEWGRNGSYCRRPDGICWQSDAPGKCFLEGDRNGENMCSEARLQRRDLARSIRWESLSPTIRDIATRFATARLSNPVPRSVDFAAYSTTDRAGYELVKRLRNSYWSTPTSRAWPADQVRIEHGGRVATGSDSVGLIGLLALVGAGVGGAFVYKRYRRGRR